VIVDPREEDGASCAAPDSGSRWAASPRAYAVDKAAAVLRRAGFENFIVQAGVRHAGLGSQGRPSLAGRIRDPRGARDALFAAAEVEDRTFSTSGDYERFTVRTAAATTTSWIHAPAIGHRLPLGDDHGEGRGHRRGVVEDRLHLGSRRGPCVSSRRPPTSRLWSSTARTGFHVSRGLKDKLSACPTPPGHLSSTFR
jgi:hypothetical protein